MAATSNPSTPSTAAKASEPDMVELMRTAVQEALESLMHQEVTTQIGAEPHERTAARRVQRNGHRIRKLETQLGSLEIRIPKLREGSYFPSFLEPHCRVHASLVAVVSEAYTQGISTRKMEDLAQALGMSGLSKSAVSRMLEDLGEGVRQYCQRSLPRCPYVFLDARYEQVRDHGRIVSRAVLVAVGVTQEGRRELLGYTVAAAESEETWSAFLRGLVERGLTGVRLTVSDANQGLRRAIVQTLPGSTWQRCSIHLGRNLAGVVSHRHRGEVLALLKLILTSPDIAAAREQLKTVQVILERRHPQAAAILAEAGEDMIAFLHFPQAHWRKLHSTNLVERLNRELKRRTRVVSIFPNDTSLGNLVGAVLERIYLAWAGERYISQESMAGLRDPLAAVRSELNPKTAA